MAAGLPPPNPRKTLPNGFIRCWRCKAVKAHADFYENRATHTGRSNTCVSCATEARREKGAKPRVAKPKPVKPPKPPVPPRHAVCIGCEQTKPLEAFYARPDTKQGHTGRCKVCYDHAQRERRKARIAAKPPKPAKPPQPVKPPTVVKPPKPPRPVKSAVPQGHVQCTGCLQTKPLEAFHTQNDRSRGFKGRCRECVNAWKARKSQIQAEQHASKRKSIDHSGKLRCMGCESFKAFYEFELTEKGTYSKWCALCVEVQRRLEGEGRAASEKPKPPPYAGEPAASRQEVGRYLMEHASDSPFRNQATGMVVRSDLSESVISYLGRFSRG